MLMHPAPNSETSSLPSLRFFMVIVPLGSGYADQAIGATANPAPMRPALISNSRRVSSGPRQVFSPDDLVGLSMAGSLVELRVQVSPPRDTVGLGPLKKKALALHRRHEAKLQNMKLRQLDGLVAFWKVAEHRGFTAAAAELEVSPSALSQAIRQLESRLGVLLLHRTTRSVSLTEAGELYLARVGPALGQVVEAGEELNVLQGRPAGTLRLNAARISTAMVLQPMLAEFLPENPHVQLELTNDEGFVDIVERGFDAGVRMGESVHRDMVAVPLGGPITIAVVASPEYLMRVPAPDSPG